jgi:Cro/C1-type HTH DNA-binding domain
VEDHRPDPIAPVAWHQPVPAQVHRLVTSTPEIPARTFAALCDILDCTPNDLFEPFRALRRDASRGNRRGPTPPRGHRRQARSANRSSSPTPPAARRRVLMAKPRKPDDPYRRRELPCDRCGGGYYLVVAWAVDDEICGYCYQQAKRTRGPCACGHVGILPGRVNGQPCLPDLQRHHAEHRLRLLRRGGRAVQRRTLLELHPWRDGGPGPARLQNHYSPWPRH